MGKVCSHRALSIASSARYFEVVRNTALRGCLDTKRRTVVEAVICCEFFNDVDQQSESEYGSEEKHLITCLHNINRIMVSSGERTPYSPFHKTKWQAILLKE